MDPASLVRKSDFEWWIPATGGVRVPGVIYASEALSRDMDEKVREFARRIQDAGLQPGDRLIIWSDNCPEWIAAFALLRSSFVASSRSQLLAESLQASESIRRSYRQPC